jgi:conjugative transfer region protein (TIGR03748 family)
MLVKNNSNLATSLNDNFDNTYQKSRYTFSENQIPTNHVNLLQQNISITFGEGVVTINDAVKQVLVNSGYQLDSRQDVYTTAILSAPLPATLRSIQNATLEQVLLALTGNNFKIEEDPIHRLINFKIKPKAKALYVNSFLDKKDV